MATQERLATTSPQHRYDFALANLAISQTGTAVPIPGAVLNTYLMPKAGYIVGYAANLSAAFTAGTAVFDITVAGTSTLTVNIGVASTTKYRAMLPTPAEPFAAGDLLGVTYTTNGSADPITNDLQVSVFVVFEEFEF